VKHWRNNNQRALQDGDSAYYSVLQLVGDGMAALRELFPDGEANDLNAVLFSTSGVHGTYCTIEEVEEDMPRVEREGPRDVTFIVVQPRIVCLRYGNVEPHTADDIAWLKKLRDSSARALSEIGAAAPSPQAPQRQEDASELRRVLELAVHAMRAPLDDWKGELERKALDAARAVLNKDQAS
jgi:hypothetical protein